MNVPAGVVRVETNVWRDGVRPAQRWLPEEVPVALTYDRVTFAVMMASPADLHDYAVGFSISEGIIQHEADIASLDIVTLPAGIECRMSLRPAARGGLEKRRRRIAGPAGCGLCGMDSLAEAIRPVAFVTTRHVVAASKIAEALAMLPNLQILNRQTRGVHAAAYFAPATGDMIVREDIGRHNALDKLIGAVRRSGNPADAGVVIITSRVSIELVQKTAAFGCGILVAVSVPSARAVADASAAGITLVAVARDDGFEIFTHPARIV